MFVEDYMTPNPLVVRTGEPVNRVAELIRQRQIHQVPVVDRQNRLVGIITDRDLRSVMGYYETSSRLGLVAEDIMTSDVVTVVAGQELIDAVEILRRGHFGALPVIDSGRRVVGILSTRDLLRRLAELLEEPSIATDARSATIVGAAS